MPLFGVLSNRAHGHAVTAILLAMIAMLFTATSYGRMARAYPTAGSAFTYVSQEIKPRTGLCHWLTMAMDMLNPVICIIWCSKAAMNFSPGSRYWMWVVFFFALFTGLILRGIKTSARINDGLAAGMGIVPMSTRRTCIVAGRVAGSWFFLTMNLTLLGASVGSGMGAQLEQLDCFTAWDEAMRCLGHSSAPLIPIVAYRATT